MPPQSGFTFSQTRHYLPYLLNRSLWAAFADPDRGSGAAFLPSVPATEPAGLLNRSTLGKLQNPAQHSVGADHRHFDHGGSVSQAVPPDTSTTGDGRDDRGHRAGPVSAGLIYPQALGFLFPASSLGTLQLLSQIGVVLFMFIVGME